MLNINCIKTKQGKNVKVVGNGKKNGLVLMQSYVYR